MGWLGHLLMQARRCREMNDGIEQNPAYGT